MMARISSLLPEKLRGEMAMKLSRMRNSDLVKLERVVDRTFYMKANPDIATAIRDPIRHFHDFGAKEGRAASPWFSPAYVYAQLGQESLHGRSVQSVYAASDMPHRPRMIFVSHEATRTGAPAIILRLIEMFGASGEIECFSLLDEGGERLQEFADVSHAYVMSKGRRDPKFSEAHTVGELSSMFAKDGIFDSNKPVCALVNSMESQRLGPILAAQGIPVVSLLHEFADYYPDNVLQRLFDTSKKVIFPSQIIQRVAFQNKAIDTGKGMVRGQGLLKDGFGALDHVACREQLRGMLNLGPDALIVLNVGSKDIRKGIDYFTETARQYLLEHPDDTQVHFVWFGGNAHRPDAAWTKASRMAAEPDLVGRVHFMPSTPDIEKVFCGADLFLLTARADPFPCVIHEAMACGLPVIAFREGGGAPELIGSDAGTTVEMGDVKAIAAAIERYRREPELRQAHADAAAARIRADWGYEGYFRDVLAVVRDAAGLPKLCAGWKPPVRQKHLVLMAGKARDLDLLARLKALNLPPVSEVVLFGGHFDPDSAVTFQALRAQGLRVRIAQPREPTPEAQAALIRQILAHVDAETTTLIAEARLLDAEHLILQRRDLRLVAAGAAVPDQDEALHFARLVDVVAETLVGSDELLQRIGKLVPARAEALVKI
jgi:hypothetical protein